MTKSVCSSSVNGEHELGARLSVDVRQMMYSQTYVHGIQRSAFAGDHVNLRPVFPPASSARLAELSSDKVRGLKHLHVAPTKRQ